MAQPAGSPTERQYTGLWQIIRTFGLRHERLDAFYFILAGLNIVTLGAVLLLNHVTLTAFTGGVDTSSIWSDRQNHLIELARSARAVDTPPNDIFESQDAERERARLREASAVFREQLADLYAHLGEHRLSARDADVMDELAASSELMSALEVISERTLRDYDRGDERLASREMVLADRTYGELMNRLEAVGSILERGRREDLEQRRARARAMQSLELAFGVCAILVVGFVLAAGVRVAAVVRAAGQDQKRMLDELGETRDRLRQYADDVSHELRVPISRMRLDAEILLGQERKNEEYRAGIEELLTQCNELASITEALLFIARAENTSMALKPDWLDISKELGLLTEYFTAPAENAGIEIVLHEASGTVWADRALMQRAISNLIRNALTHTPRGSSVRITAHGSSEGAWIEIADNGPGLSPELLPKLFERFQRGRDSEGGAGLGLAIVKSIMDLHGGKVLLSSSSGLTARLEFPGPTGSGAANVRE